MLAAAPKHLLPILFLAAYLPAQHLPDLDPKPGWLDQKSAPKSWNRSGRHVPRAPHGAGLDELCKSHLYQAQSDEEKAVAKAGWTVMGKAAALNGMVTVGGQAFNDGMCRPTQFQEFVFVQGQYAGTLSPGLMDSREDGAFSRIVSLNGARLAAEFLRYSERDPRCCPSRVTQVEYDIREESGKPVIFVKAMKTRYAQ